MAQSPEYPDLKWVTPKSWTNANRTSVQLITIHTTEGSSHASSAEDGAAYDARRTDGTSAHYFVDSTSVIQCVRTNDQAHTARGEGNRRGIHYELCGKAANSAAWWADDYATAMLKRAAKQAARDAKKWGIPVRHLTVAQVKDGAKGFCSHHDITRAFGQSTHTDPGPNFPWTKFLDMVRAELAPPAPSKPGPTDKNWSDMATQAEIEKAFENVLNKAHNLPGRVGQRLHAPKPAGPGWGPMSDRELVARLFEGLLGLTNLVTAFVEYEKTEDTGERAADETRAAALARIEEAAARIEAAVDPAESEEAKS